MIFINLILLLTLTSTLSTTQTITDDGCGGNRTGMSGIVKSPGYSSHNYSSNSSCSWMITVPDNMVVQLHFDAIDIESESQCAFDGVIIYDVVPGFHLNLTMQNATHYLGRTRYCGNESYPVIASQTNQVGIIFYSDSYHEKTGFKLDWKAMFAEDSFNCTFDQGLCKGWKNGNFSSDDFDWQFNKMSTPSYSTGPMVDHTLQNDHGGYLYIETSQPQKPNQTAILQAPTIWLEEEIETLCVSFWYHMYGDDVGALLVVEGQTQHPVRWAETEEIGQDWVEGKIEFQNLTQSLNISFVGIRGWGNLGDIALDDVTVSRGKCTNINEKPFPKGQIKDYFTSMTQKKMQPPPLPPASIACQNDDYRCISGTKCISRQFLCDRKKDCPDNDDEYACQHCPYDDDFLCRNNTCIPGWGRCNGVEDCVDGGDEEDCAITAEPEYDSTPDDQLLIEYPTNSLQDEEDIQTRKKDRNHSYAEPLDNLTTNFHQSIFEETTSTKSHKIETETLTVNQQEESFTNQPHYEPSKVTTAEDDMKTNANYEDKPKVKDQISNQADNSTSVKILKTPTKSPHKKIETTSTGGARETSYKFSLILQVTILTAVTNYIL